MAALTTRGQANVTKENENELPASLRGHSLAPEVVEQIRSHVRRLSESALEVSESLPLGASSGDIFRVLERD